MATVKPLRETMPAVAAWVDELRAVFGEEDVDVTIRAGLAGQPVFWAREGGHEIGTRPRHGGNAWRGEGFEGRFCDPRCVRGCPGLRELCPRGQRRSRFSAQ